VAITRNPLLERAAFASTHSTNLGALDIPNDVIIEDNPKLQTPPGWGETGRIGGSLTISRKDVLQIGNFLIQGNPSLKDFLSGAPRVKYIGGSLIIRDNPAFDWAAFLYLETLGDLSFGAQLWSLKRVGGR
jgi:hypothetical protein